MGHPECERLRMAADRERKVDHAVILHDAHEGGGGRLHLLHSALQSGRLLLLAAELIRRKFLTCILPPLLAATGSANFLTPMLAGWSVLFKWPKRMTRS